MLCYAVVGPVPANEVRAMSEALRRNMGAFVTQTEGWDSVCIQGCTMGEQAPHINGVIEFLDNHGYNRHSIVGQDSAGNPSPAHPMAPCAETGVFFPLSELHMVPGQNRNEPFRRVCPDYFNAHYFRCPFCTRERAIETRRATPAGDNRPICNNCYRDQCRDCSECERVHWSHESRYDDHEEEYLCRSCYQEMRGDYFAGQERRFARRNSFGSSRSYGIELETNRGTASDQYAFSCKEDGSVDGWEFVSHILRGDEGMTEIQNFLSSGHNIRLGDNCGFHLHFSVRDLDDREKYTVLAAYLSLQEYFFSYVERHRRENTYCRRMNQASVLLNVHTALARGTEFEDYAGNLNRYDWFNVSAFVRHGTFENRLHHATWDFAAIQRWIILNLRFVRYARTIQLEANETLASIRDKAELAMNQALAYFNESVAVPA